MLANFMKLLLIENSLTDGDYAEAFAGGGAIAWSLLFGEFVHNVFINGISRPVMAFWRSVLNSTEDICRLIHDTPVDIEEWYQRRQIVRHPGDFSDLDLGFSSFFLNRTNRSGILQAGVIGGKAQNGDWKLDARYNKSDLLARIERIAAYKSRIHLSQLDAELFISDVLPTTSLQALVYLDPPYYIKGKELYENHYIPGDHERLSAAVQERIERPWVVSYDCHPQIVNLYLARTQFQYDLSYSAQDRYFGTELPIFSDQLRVPVMDRPAYIDARQVRDALLATVRLDVRKRPRALSRPHPPAKLDS